MGEVQPLADDDPRRVGPYVVTGRIGSGGMGRVYLAETPDGERVAVKVVRPDFADDPEFRRRFRREVAAAQRVHGRFTAAVVDADVDDDRPWLATEYVPGPSLREAVTEHGPMAPDEVLALAARLAEALRAVHDAGLVHRDLKPSNVLLADDGPRVIDFGIVRAADVANPTIAPGPMGSPHFMAPEQATGEPMSAATDVFALGAVVVYAATGRAPFGDGAAPAMLYRAVHEPPDLTGLPDDLRALAAACLDKDPANRPTLDEVVRLCDPTEDDEVRPVRVRARWGHWRYGLAGAFLAIVLSIALGALFVGLLPGEAAEQAPSELVATLPASPTERLLAFSPDSNFLAATGEGFTVEVWDVRTGERAHTLRGHTDTIDHLEFGPRGRLATSDVAGNVKVWDHAHGEEIDSFDAMRLNGLGFDERGDVIGIRLSGRSDLAGLRDGSLWRVPGSGLPDVGTPASSLAFSPDGRTLVSAGEGNAVTLWGVADSRRIVTMPVIGETVRILGFSANGRLLATVEGYFDFSNLGSVRKPVVTVRDLRTHQLVATLPIPARTDRPQPVAMSGDGRVIVTTAGDSGDFLALRRVTGAEYVDLLTTVADGEVGPALAVAISPNARYVAAATRDQNEIQLWDVSQAVADVPVADPFASR